MEPTITTRTMRLRCACGWETTGTEDQVVAASQEHGRRMHNMSASRDEVLAMVIPDEGSMADGAEGAPAAGDDR